MTLRPSDSVSVVIPTLNRLDLLHATLVSVLGQTHSTFDVTVVDNGSSPPIREDLSIDGMSPRVLRLERNFGIGAAINAGVAATSGPLVAILNNDVELEPRWLETLIDALRRRPEAGSAVGKLLMLRDRVSVDGAGDVVYTSGVAARRGYGERDTGQYDAEEFVFSACGAAALYRRSALDDVGPFDADFYAYLEDVDWGFRAQLLGYKCLYVPAAVAYHVGSATTGAREVRMQYDRLLQRNTIALVVKNFPAPTLMRCLPSMIAFHTAWLARSLSAHELRSHLSAYRDGLAGLPRALAKRRSIQRRRRVEPEYVRRILTPPAWRLRARATLRAALLGRRSMTIG